jgi:hypothetical protein
VDRTFAHPTKNLEWLFACGKLARLAQESSGDIERGLHDGKIDALWYMAILLMSK